MAKFNIEVNLDWVDEEGNIDDELKEAITSAIVSKISASATQGIEEKVNEIVNGRLNNDVSEKLNSVMEEFFDKPRTITDRYGDTIQRDVSVMDLLKKACDDFIDARVDKDGKIIRGSYYGDPKTRIDYLIEKKIDYNMQSAINRAADEFTKKLTNHVNKAVKDRLGENVAKIAGLDDILKAVK